MLNQTEKMTEVLNNKFEILSNIGNGSFGNVFLARVRNSDSPEPSLVAIKTMKRSFQTVSDCLKLREIQFLQKLPPHPHIILVYNSFLDPTTKRLHMVMEHMEGNLYQLIKSRNKKVFDIQTIQNILYQILSAIKHIHDHNFFHRDIKPENILVSSVSSQKLSKLPNFNKFQTYSEDVTYIIKLADFGLAREITSQSPYTSYVSTRWYRAPEVLLRANEYSTPVDIWAFGAMAVELATFRPLFPGTNEIDQIWRICEIIGSPATWIHADKNIEIGGGEWKKGLKLAEKLGFSFPKIPPISLETILSDSWPSSFASFIRSTMQWDPLRRPNCIQSLQHQFFHKINNSPEISTIEINTNSTSTSPQSLQENLNTKLENSQNEKIKFVTNKVLFINEKQLHIYSELQKKLSFNLYHSWFRKKYKTIDSKKLKSKNIPNNNLLEFNTNSWKLRSKNRCCCLICKNRTSKLEALKESAVSKKNDQISLELLKKSTLYQKNVVFTKPLIVNKNQSNHSSTKMGYPLFNSIILNTRNSIVNHPEKIESDMSFFSHLQKKDRLSKNLDLKILCSFRENQYINNLQNVPNFQTFEVSDQNLKNFNIKSNTKKIEKTLQTIYNSIVYPRKSHTDISQNKLSYSINQHQLINRFISSTAENSESLNALSHDISYEYSINENKLIKNKLCSACYVSTKREIDITRMEKNKEHHHNCHLYEYNLESEKTKKPFLKDSTSKLLLKHISRPFNISKLYSNLNLIHQKSTCTSLQNKHFSKHENNCKQNILIKKKKPLVIYQVQFKIKHS
ncbi:hypothetical protein PMAC_001215 [Pneumocystis sp. 'macacae']|nr:hypothetical protein PMAC_001215 [Pneumocystis sp. 'macacae']